MNRIHRTLRNRHTGAAVAVSERTGARAGASSSARPARRRPLAAALALLAAGGLACTSARAQSPETYDGTQPALRSASSLNLPGWLVSPSTKGLLHGAPGGTQTGASLTIDYATGVTPGFVIGGYSDTGAALSNNTVTIAKGPVDGPVYGGLSHWTKISETVTITFDGTDTSADSSVVLSGKSATADHQTVTVEADNTVMGDVYGGAAVIWAQTGDADAGDASAYAYATADANASGSAHADGNKVDIGQSATLTAEAGIIDLNLAFEDIALLAFGHRPHRLVVDKPGSGVAHPQLAHERER